MLTALTFVDFVSIHVFQGNTTGLSVEIYNFLNFCDKYDC